MKATSIQEKSFKKVERIVAPPPPHWVGDGFYVHGFFPHGPLSAKRMSPFFLLDYNALMDYPPREDPFGVGPHPHRGFETVTIAYKGEVEHHDSYGGGGVIREGDVQWMTAGSGLLHKEFHEKEFNRAGGAFQMVQLWVNLPAKDKMTTPKYQAIERSEMGRVPVGSGEVEIIAGEFNGVKGPATTYSPVNMLNVRPAKGEKITLEFPANYTTLVLAIEGSGRINGSEELKTDHMALFEREGERFTLETEDERATFLVLSGEPIDEPIAAYGPFLMNTQEEIAQAIEDFQKGKFGRLD